MKQVPGNSKFVISDSARNRLANHEIEKIENFLCSIEEVSEAYKNQASFSYFAVNVEGVWKLKRGAIHLDVIPDKSPVGTSRSANAVAGCVLLSTIGLTFKDLIEKLVEGPIQLGNVELFFQPSSNGGFSCHSTGLHEESRLAGNRVASLTIRGDSQYVDTTTLDWELKSSEVPFDSVAEVLSAYRLFGRADGDATIEVFATTVAVIDAASVVSGELAKPAIFLAKQLEPKRASIGYRLFHSGKVVRRAQITSEDLRWSQLGVAMRGETSIKIPVGGTLHCYARYAGVTHNQCWLADPSTFQNSRRATYEAFDPGLQILKDLIAKSRVSGRDAREFEVVVSWLLWMQGFSTLLLGNTKRTTDAPDIVCHTASGNLLVVECTTGTLKADHKISHLIERTAAIRARLDAGGNRHIKILPVIVTCKTRAEVAADLEQAERLGVLVRTSEDIDEAINSTLTQQDPDALFEEGVRQVAELKSTREANER